MHLRTTTYLLLSATVFAAVAPAASATPHNACTTIDWQHTVCLDAGSYGNGSCDDVNGYDANFVSARYTNYADGTDAGASAGTSCSSYDHEWDGSRVRGEDHGVGAWLWTHDDGQWSSNGASWYAYEGESDWGPYRGCGITLVADNEWIFRDCPAGQPPVVPAILP